MWFNKLPTYTELQRILLLEDLQVVDHLEDYKRNFSFLPPSFQLLYSALSNRESTALISGEQEIVCSVLKARTKEQVQEQTSAPPPSHVQAHEQKASAPRTNECYGSSVFWSLHTNRKLRFSPRMQEWRCPCVWLLLPTTNKEDRRLQLSRKESCSRLQKHAQDGLTAGYLRLPHSYRRLLTNRDEGTPLSQLLALVLSPTHEYTFLCLRLEQYIGTIGW